MVKICDVGAERRILGHMLGRDPEFIGEVAAELVWKSKRDLHVVVEDLLAMIQEAGACDVPLLDDVETVKSAARARQRAMMVR